MAKATTIGELNELLAEKLRTFRPHGRYSPADKGWQERAARAVMGAIEDSPQVVEALVLAQASKLEGRATRSANDLLRKAAKDAQPPLEWFGAEDAPIAFEMAQAVDGEVRQVEVRVRLGDATADDFDQWIVTETKRLERDVQQREAAIEGAGVIVEFLTSSGFRTLSEWQKSMVGESA